MKAVSLASRILAAVLGVATFALLWFGIVHVASAQGTFELSAAQLAFGSKLTMDSAGNALKEAVDLNQSAWYFFTFFTAAIAAICGCVSLIRKDNKASTASLVFGAVTGLMTVLFICNTPGTYVDHRPLSKIGGQIWYNNTFIALLCVALGFVVATIASILIFDYVTVKESNGAKKVLWVRFKSWLLEYKSEVRKVTWPKIPTVVRNTVIVLIMCAIMSLIIGLADLGLGKLLELIFGS